MKSALQPENEAERLAALQRYAVLDTRQEQPFDDLTHLAAYICQTPIALISLVDEKRQWFKSRHGLDAPETSREIAFCAHAILNEEGLEVPDTLDDERFHDNPLVTSGPKIRFYAGARLLTPDGQAIGTLCAIDTKPRKLSPEQKDALAALGRQAMLLLEMRSGFKRLRGTLDTLLNVQAQLGESCHQVSRMSNFSELTLSPALQQIAGALRGMTANSPADALRAPLQQLEQIQAELQQRLGRLAPK